MTDDERKIADIDERVRKTISPTFSSDGGASIEGRISRDDFEYLMCSLLAWRLVAKQNGTLASLTPLQYKNMLETALEEEIDAHMKTRAELDELQAHDAALEDAMDNDEINGVTPKNDVHIVNPLVAMLEEAITRIKAGQFVSAAVIGIGPQGQVQTAFGGPQNSEMYLGAAIVQRQLLEVVTAPQKQHAEDSAAWHAAELTMFAYFRFWRLRHDLRWPFIARLFCQSKCTRRRT